jgi:hypothetical protein
VLCCKHVHTRAARAKPWHVIVHSDTQTRSNSLCKHKLYGQLSITRFHTPQPAIQPASKHILFCHAHADAEPHHSCAEAPCPHANVSISQPALNRQRDTVKPIPASPGTSLTDKNILNNSSCMLPQHVAVHTVYIGCKPNPTHVTQACKGDARSLNKPRCTPQQNKKALHPDEMPPAPCLRFCALQCRRNICAEHQHCQGHAAHFNICMTSCLSSYNRSQCVDPGWLLTAAHAACLYSAHKAVCIQLMRLPALTRQPSPAVIENSRQQPGQHASDFCSMILASSMHAPLAAAQLNSVCCS